MPRVFGLTGGITCGKSTVSRIFTENGVPVVDANRVSQEVVGPGTLGLRQLTLAFGEDILQEDGCLDRVKLGARVFLNLADRVRLNDILRPLIALRSGELMREHLSAGFELVCFDAPALIEAGMHERFRPLVVVIAPEEVQLRQLMKRGFAEAEAKAYLSSQLPNLAKTSLADIVINNDGYKEDLSTKTLKALSVLRSIYL